MPVRRASPLPLALSALLLAALACSLPAVSQSTDDSAELQTLQALGTQVAVETASADEVAPPASGADEPTPAAPEVSPTPEAPTAAPTVAHVTFPSNPGSVNSFMTDRSSRPLAAERRAIADNFDRLLFERPFSSQQMDYAQWLDITRGELSAQPPWFYVSLYLEGQAPADSTARYGVEIDLDQDGRGDWLIWGLTPADSEWTTDGVQVLRDRNGNVGDGQPIQAEPPPQSGDGYEDQVFDSGIGPDPDAAWIRWGPGSPSQIQLAFKQSLIGSPGEFLWGVWADEGPQEPTWFDYNDHFSLSEAGSPVSSTNYYPLQSLAQVDNSCRWGYGFEPDGDEPGICFIPPTPTPTPSPTPVPEGSISGTVYQGNSSTPSSSRLSGVTVTLGQGSCSSSGYASTSTGGNGGYSFSGLPPGTYCVTVRKNTLPSAPYGWSTMYPSGFSNPNTNPYQQITIGPDETRGSVNFAFLQIVG